MENIDEEKLFDTTTTKTTTPTTTIDSRVEVFVRIKPRGSANREESLALHNVANEITIQEEKYRTVYEFGHVFSEDKTNIDVCEVVCDPLISTVLKGFNASFIAYGQHGTGKKHTVLSEDGVILQTVEKLFYEITLLSNSHCTISFSYLQVYQDRIYDLLFNRTAKPLPVRENPNGGVIIEGLSKENIESLQEAKNLLSIGKRKLAVVDTETAHSSSRSHAICIITVEKREIKSIDESPYKIHSLTSSNIEVQTSKLYLCDLAGSERLKKTTISGRRLKEAKYINTSLLELGNVIHALGSKHTVHIPFRNSTLTRILKESLGWNCKTTLMICVSPHWKDLNETRSSLNFGQRAMFVGINKENIYSRTDSRWLNCPLSRRRNFKIDYKALSEMLTAKLKEIEAAYKQEKESLRKLQGKLSKRSLDDEEINKPYQDISLNRLSVLLEDKTDIDRSSEGCNFETVKQTPSDHEEKGSMPAELIEDVPTESDSGETDLGEILQESMEPCKHDIGVQSEEISLPGRILLTQFSNTTKQTMVYEISKEQEEEQEQEESICFVMNENCDVVDGKACQSMSGGGTQSNLFQSNVDTVPTTSKVTKDTFTSVKTFNEATTQTQSVDCCPCPVQKTQSVSCDTRSLSEGMDTDVHMTSVPSEETSDPSHTKDENNNYNHPSTIETKNDFLSNDFSYVECSFVDIDNNVETKIAEIFPSPQENVEQGTQKLVGQWNFVENETEKNTSKPKKASSERTSYSSVDSDTEYLFEADTMLAKMSLMKTRNKCDELLQCFEDITSKNMEDEKELWNTSSCYEHVLKFKRELEEELNKAKLQLEADNLEPQAKKCLFTVTDPQCSNTTTAKRGCVSPVETEPCTGPYTDADLNTCDQIDEFLENDDVKTSSPSRDNVCNPEDIFIDEVKNSLSKQRQQDVQRQKIAMAAIENCEIKKELLLTKLEKIRLEAVLSCIVSNESTDMTKEFQQLSLQSMRRLAFSRSTLSSSASCAHLPSTSQITFQSLPSPLKKYSFNERFLTPSEFHFARTQASLTQTGSATRDVNTGVARSVQTDFVKQWLQSENSRSRTKLTLSTSSSSDFDVSSMSDMNSPSLLKRFSPCGQDHDDASKGSLLDDDLRSIDELLIRYKRKGRFSLSCLPFLRKRSIRKKIKEHNIDDSKSC